MKQEMPQSKCWRRSGPGWNVLVLLTGQRFRETNARIEKPVVAAGEFLRNRTQRSAEAAQPEIKNPVDGEVVIGQLVSRGHAGSFFTL
jgi:hypothetical protein